MQPAINYQAQEQFWANVSLVGAAVLFCGAPCFGLGYLVARRWKLRKARVILFGGALGVALAALLMMWLGNTGAAFAFCALVGVYFGASHAEQANKYRMRRTRARESRLRRSGGGAER
jgi:FtsH-binding integral membrane protein